MLIFLKNRLTTKIKVPLLHVKRLKHPRTSFGKLQLHPLKRKETLRRNPRLIRQYSR